MQKYKNMTSGYFPEVMFLFLIFVFVRKNFPGNIHGPSLALFKGSSYIFTDNSDAEQLHTAASAAVQQTDKEMLLQR